MMKTYADKSTQTMMKTYADKSTQTISGIDDASRTTSTSGSSSEDFHELMEATASTSSISSFLNKLKLLSTKRTHSPTTSSSSKKMKKPSTSGGKENVYKFKVQFKYVKKTYRIILLKGASSLHELAEAITSAFDFDMDHAFAFYNDVDQDTSTATYTYFADMEDIILQPEEMDDKSVAHCYIYEVFQPRDKWLFYYDYGQDWEFLVECQDDNVKAEPGAEYPQVIKKNGKAPPQYGYPSDEDHSSDD